jgi:amylosucrase
VASENLAARLVTEFGPRAHHELAAEDAEAFIVGLIRILPDAVRTLDELYGMRTDTSDLVRRLVSDALTHAVARDASLRRLDRARMDSPTWFQDARMIGYVCYADRFASTLRGVRSHLDHLTDLGVTYLHLMAVLKPREGDNDGGYAVADYDAVDPRLGTMGDFTELADALHARGIALCVDVVLNHTAAEHEWARKSIPTAPNPTRTNTRCRTSFPTSRRAASPTPRNSTGGSGRPSTATNGTSTTPIHMSSGQC